MKKIKYPKCAKCGYEFQIKEVEITCEKGITAPKYCAVCEKLMKKV